MAYGPHNLQELIAENIRQAEIIAELREENSRLREEKDTAAGGKGRKKSDEK